MPYGMFPEVQNNIRKVDRMTNRYIDKEEDANIDIFRECSECSRKTGSPVLCAGCLSNRSVISYLNKTIELQESTIKRLKEERNRRVDNTDLGIISERLEEDNRGKDASLVRSLMHQKLNMDKVADLLLEVVDRSVKEYDKAKTLEEVMKIQGMLHFAIDRIILDIKHPT